MANLTNSPFAELYSSKLQDLMLENNSFLTLWSNESSWINNRIVHIPQYNNAASIMEDYVKVGGANYGFGSTGDNRIAENDLTFTLRSHQTEPITVVSLEDTITNYDKFGGTVKNTIKSLVEFQGKSLLRQAAVNVPTGNTVVTTGGATSTAPDGTTRKAVLFADLITLGLKMDEDNVSSEGRFLVLPARMYADLISDATIQKANELGTGEAPIASGVVLKLNGINIIKKNTVLQMSGNSDGSDTVDPFTNAAAQAYHGGLAFVSDAIAYASDSVEVFTNEKDPQKFGDEFSSQVYSGARSAREDNKGVYILAQG